MRTLPLHLTPEQRCNCSEVSQLMPFTGLLWLLFTYISRRRRVGHRYRLNYPANVIHSKLVNSFALIWWNVFSFSLINEIVSITQQHSVFNPGLPPQFAKFPRVSVEAVWPVCASSQHWIETPLMDGRWWSHSSQDTRPYRIQVTNIHFLLKTKYFCLEIAACNKFLKSLNHNFTATGEHNFQKYRENRCTDCGPLTSMIFLDLLTSLEMYFRTYLLFTKFCNGIVNKLQFSK